MFRRIALVSILLVVFLTTVQAQTVDEIVGKFVTATGGAEKWKGLQTLVVISRSPAFSFDLYWKKPNRIRIEVPVEVPEPGLDIRSFDGTTAWRLSALEGADKPRGMSESETLDLLEMGDAYRELIDYKAKGYTVELQGKESVNNSPAHKLKVTKPSGASVFIYIDAKSFLEVQRVIHTRSPEGEDRTLVTMVSDYRPVGGLLLPHRIGSAVREYKVNIPMEEGGFKMPGSDESQQAVAPIKKGESLTERLATPAQRAALLKENPKADINGDGILDLEEAWAFFKKDKAARKLLPVGSAAPDWTLKDSNNRIHRLSEYRGKVVVMDFWAVWCIPCHRAMPWLENLNKNLAKRRVVVMGISTGEHGGDPVRLMKDRGYSYLLMLNGETISEAYAIAGLPTMYVVGTDGRIIYSGIGTNPHLDQQRSALIEDYLKQQGM